MNNITLADIDQNRPAPNSMKLIPLTQGKFAMVDDVDYEGVNAHKWHAKKMGRSFYAARNIRKPDGSRGTQLLHQFLMPGAAEIDHRDGNSLNNQRSNLRPATQQQNMRGFQRKQLGTTSRFRGVCWDKESSRWYASITVDKQINLGRFKLEEDAARARDAAALKYHGKFAHLNFP